MNDSSLSRDVFKSERNFKYSFGQFTLPMRRILPVGMYCMQIRDTPQTLITSATILLTLFAVWRNPLLVIETITFNFT